MIDTAMADVLPYKSSRSSLKPFLMSSALDNDRRNMGRVSPYPSAAPSGRSSPIALATVARADIADALSRSPDGGATLDFSDRNLVDIGESGAEELAKVGRGDDLADESSVHRIALVGNRLATLPLAFSLLSHLRYLTLRSNSFSGFPEVLTIMPSLEILDFSRNKLKRLPSNPGSLVNLRVFSLSRNKLQKLPAYFSNFHSLSVLKLDHNPLEWPPRAVIESADDLDEPENMRQWVNSLKHWLADNSTAGSLQDGRKPSDESLPHSESSRTELSSGEEIAPHYTATSWSLSASQETDFHDGVTPHARSFSIDSQSSVYSSASYVPSTESTKPDRPPPLRLGFLPSPNPSCSSGSPETYLPTPEDSLTSADDDASRALKQHGRNASYACAEPSSARNSALAIKKSLPDLRSAKVHFAPDGRKVADDAHSPPLSHGQTRGAPTMAMPEVQPLRIRTNARSVRPGTAPSPESTDGPAPSMDNERNSYFRRLSTLPTSTISSTIPHALLMLVDAVRGILFAVSQVYQTLQHYTVYAMDERLSSVLLKVIDPASTYMSQLITALDRFDSMSRRGLPPPYVCRSVVESCRENVAVFGKAVGVLALQLKVLATQDDVRYTRQMLLVLYGAMAEISNAWQGMAPHLEAVEPLLRDSRTPPITSKAHMSAHTRIQIPPIAEQPEPASTLATPSSAFPRGAPVAHGNAAQPGGRTRMNRRHAGSFSIKDVEIGKSLPSNMNLASPAGGIVSGTASTVPTPRPTPRLPLPLASLGGAGPSHPLSSTSPHPPHPLPSSSHLRQDSQTLPLPSPLTSISPSLPPKGHGLEIPCNSHTLVDKEAIDAMDGAIKAAPAVWAMLDEILNDMPETTVDLRVSLSKAQAITDKLRGNIKAIQECSPSADRKALREDGHVFVKTVIQLSNVVKTYDSAHRLSAQLRKDIAKLTNSTQEFVMLMHVSSYSPSSAVRPYSPMLATAPPAAQVAPISALSPVAEDLKYGAALSRSRSAQPAASSKVSPQTAKAVPRSALPNQTFKIPPLPRLGAKLRTVEGVVDGPG